MGDEDGNNMWKIQGNVGNYGDDLSDWVENTLKQCRELLDQKL